MKHFSAAVCSNQDRGMSEPRLIIGELSHNTVSRHVRYELHIRELNYLPLLVPKER
jgi:hypothetical protein